MALSMMIIGPATASAAETVRINEVYPQVGYSIVYNLYLQTDTDAATLQGRLNYDQSVLDLTNLSFDNEDTINSSTTTIGDMARVSFEGTKSSYDTVSSRIRKHLQFPRLQLLRDETKGSFPVSPSQHISSLRVGKPGTPTALTHDSQN